MEPTQTRKFSGVLIIAAIVVAAAAAGAFLAMRGLSATPLSKFIKPDLPTLDLKLEFVTTNGEKIPLEQTHLGAGGSNAPAKPSPDAGEECPELVGGDTRDRTVLSEDEKRGEKCSKTARWVVKRHPIAFSLYFRDGEKVSALFDDKAPVRELLRTRFMQGVFYEPLHNIELRAEDMGLEGIQGTFLETFLREALAAHAELHYDIAHGKRGFVFSFIRKECPFASKALPVMARTLSRAGYRVPGLEVPILEMRVGLQRFFLTEHEGRIYMANGLEGLLNTLESLPADGRGDMKAPLVLTTRTEAFMAKVLPVMVGKDSLEIELGFGLTMQTPGALAFDAGKLTAGLRSKVFKGVFAGIPHDVFAAVVTGYHLAPDMNVQDWRRLATAGPEEGKVHDTSEGGFAVVWDMDAETSGISTMGVVIANHKSPDAVDGFKSYFTDGELTAQCGGGTVFLAATSEKLLRRMKESCGKQSLSVLDWERGERAKDFEAAQFFLFMNPGSGMRELFLAGGARSGDESGEFEPKWKREYEQAKEAMRRDGEGVFAGLPIFAYAGNAPATAKTVELKGFIVKQGASR